MNSRRTLPTLAAAALLGVSGCAFITGLTSAGGADASAFTVDMERYDVKSIDLAPQGVQGAICPGSNVTFKITAAAIDKKKSADTELETADPSASANEARGKMDLGEFAMAVRGGKIDNGVFATTPDPFAVLLGFDVKATYRLDKTKEVTKHYSPEYSCILEVGGSGSSGSGGSSGNMGSSNGGAGGYGGTGEAGGPGPRLEAHVSIVQTPLYDRVGIVRVTGDREQMTFFDLSTGITIAARGGPGGHGGSGGQGGKGVEGGGTGGPGGPGGDGGAGGDGGQVLVTLDDRYPELGQAVRVDVSGGSPGGGGNGGYGGQGGNPPKTCSGCKTLPPGAQGPHGPDGRSGSSAGRPGSHEIRASDTTPVFAELPPGVRLRADPRPEPVELPPPPPTKPTKGKKKPAPTG